MKIVVIDDDPTGSQTVNNCLLLLKWDYATLVKGFQSNSNLFFILANTRSLSENDAKLRLEEICTCIKEVISTECYSEEEIIFVSRGDSTLRGHNFLEPYTIDRFLGPFDATFHIPAFIEGKRLTINGNHYVDKIPINQTIFAKDTIFGFETSNIKNLLFEKSKFQINLSNIENLKLSELEILESKENNIVFKKLKAFNQNNHVIVDVENYSQLKKFSLAIKKLSKQKKFLFRTAASFISSISNIKNNINQPSFYSNLRIKDPQSQYLPGLIVVGSYVELTTIQLNRILEIDLCKPIKLDVFDFYKLITSKDYKNKLNSFKNKLLKDIRFNQKEGNTPVLYTSREVLTFKDSKRQIDFYNSLANFISELVAELKNEIGYLISKGGITTNIILSSGLKADYVYLQGQILTGISVVTLKLGNNSSLPIATFPGNIGNNESLAQVWSILENKAKFLIKNLQ